jgi:hypothetical protein
MTILKIERIPERNSKTFIKVGIYNNYKYYGGYRNYRIEG